MGTYDLGRFVEAQAMAYPAALAELEQGRKTGHWIWFVFPQIAGLGTSLMATHYAIADLGEAQAYLAHQVLGKRLRACTAAVLGHPGRTAEAMLGPTDAVKLRSSLTLFEAADADPESVFGAALDALFGGVRDPATLERL